MAIFIFDHTHIKLRVNFYLSWICIMCKKPVHSINSFWNAVNFRILWPDWSQPFVTIPTLEYFAQFLISVNLYQHEKKLFHWFVLEIGLVKINPAVWLAENILVHISRTKFSLNMEFVQNTANNINFHYRTNLVKIKDQIFQ